MTDGRYATGSATSGACSSCSKLSCAEIPYPTVESKRSTAPRLLVRRDRWTGGGAHGYAEGV